LNLLDRWVSTSIRRHYLDKALQEASGEMRGRVLEIGNGRIGRRGAFLPPQEGVTKWTYLDLRKEVQPDIVANVEAIPVPDAAHDTVVMLEVLEYVEDVQGALNEVSRVLASNGKLIISVPFFHRMDAETDRWRYTASGLKELLHHSSFEVETFTSQGSIFAVVLSPIKFLLGKIQPAPLRWGCVLLAWIPFEAVLFFDALLLKGKAKEKPFTTGYLVIAKKGRSSS
jgi:SAM-dependent methyltransferase